MIDFFVDEQVILSPTVLMVSVTAVMDLATLQKNVQARFLPQENNATRKGLIRGHDTPTPKGTDYNLLTIDTDIANISTDHNHTNDPTVSEALAVTYYTHCATHPAITAVCFTL